MSSSLEHGSEQLKQTLTKQKTRFTVSKATYTFSSHNSVE